MPIRGRSGKRINQTPAPAAPAVVPAAPSPALAAPAPAPAAPAATKRSRTRTSKIYPSSTPVSMKSSIPIRRAPSPAPVRRAPSPAPAPVKRSSTPTRRAPSPAPAPVKRSSTPTRRAPSPLVIRKDDGKEHSSVLKRSDTPPRMRLRK